MQNLLYNKCLQIQIHLNQCIDVSLPIFTKNNIYREAGTISFSSAFPVTDFFAMIHSFYCINAKGPSSDVRVAGYENKIGIPMERRRRRIQRLYETH